MIELPPKPVSSTPANSWPRFVLGGWRRPPVVTRTSWSPLEENAVVFANSTLTPVTTRGVVRSLGAAASSAGAHTRPRIRGAFRGQSDTLRRAAPYGQQQFSMRTKCSVAQLFKSNEAIVWQCCVGEAPGRRGQPISCVRPGEAPQGRRSGPWTCDASLRAFTLSCGFVGMSDAPRRSLERAMPPCAPSP